jgi:dinuclear metal center YbgI/SA1388 family protein
MPTIATVATWLRQFAPLELTESWDNVGLLLGDEAAEVRKIMTCLTITPASAEEAIAQKAELIVSHHPIIFKPVQRLTSDTVEGKMLLDLARAGVAVYSPHTAFDNTAGGINDMLCRRLGLTDVQPLRRFSGDAKCKIVVFVPDGDLAKVSDALFQAGAGVIGQYSQCSFRIAGTGTFFGSDAANPTIGQKGRREEVAEWRLEVICAESKVTEAVQAMRRAHSYEEPAFDLYPLRPLPSSLGAGRIGQLPKAERLDAFAQRVRKALACGPVQVIGQRDRNIQRVAVVCGAGGALLPDAIKSGADVLVTGEVRFHDQLAAEGSNLAVILPGHYATERPGVEELAKLLAGAFADVQVWASRREAEPAWTIGEVSSE